MGAQQGVLILAMGTKPKEQEYKKDRLIWLSSKTGNYTVKEGYNNMWRLTQIQTHQSEQAKEAWQKLWKWKGLLPRVQTFLWRAMHDGLPTAMALHKRIHAINPMCTRCGQENEYLMHLLFFCPVSRATWCRSPFPMRVEALPLDFTQALMELTESLTEKQTVDICNIVWCLRKARNKVFFSAKKTDPREILAQAKQMEAPNVNQSENRPVRVQHKAHIPTGTEVILIDASWDVSKAMGTAMIHYDGQRSTIEAKCTSEKTNDPFHAEATAMQQALMYAQTQVEQGDQQRYEIHTDCKLLAELLTSRNMEVLPSWSH